MAERVLSRYLLLSAREGQLALSAEALALNEQLRDAHTALFRQYRQELRAAFEEHALLRTLDSGQTERWWNPVSVVAAGLLDTLQASLDELAAAILEEDDLLFEEELDAALVEGEHRMLWLLAIGGLPLTAVTGLAARLLDDESRLAVTLGHGIGGVSWRERLTRWSQDLRDRSQRWLTASVLGGRSLDDTLQGIDSAALGFQGHVTQLLSNELRHQYTLGGRTVLQMAAAQYGVAGLWLARTTPSGELDPLVCSVCAALHMTITYAEPIVDSHPNCRCLLIPVPEAYDEQRIEYRELLQLLQEDV